MDCEGIIKGLDNTFDRMRFTLRLEKKRMDENARGHT
jgi:hypothetical protein